MAGPEMFHDFTGRPRLRRGLRVDHLGDERLVLDPAGGVVHTVRGPAVKALDAAIGGRAQVDREVLAALAGAGIIEVDGVSRRSALQFAGSAAALIVTVTLPSAMAAASTAPTVSGTEGILNSYSMADGSLLYSLTHSFNATATVTRNLILGASQRNVELLLVGGGGAGGVADVDANNTVYAGGGGGGELVYIDLGPEDPSTNFTLVVAGRVSTGSGQDTVVSYSPSGTEIARAAGGGSGGGYLVDAAAGGSGGGGSSQRTAFGASTSTGAPSYGADGGSGASGTSGGGGGAGASPPTTGNSTTGGTGGSARDLSFFFTLTVADGEEAVSGELSLGGGGGGAGATNSGSGGSGAGAGATNSSIAVSGSFGSGGGGGGGVSVAGQPGAQPGWGATGAIWVRVSAP